MGFYLKRTVERETPALMAERLRLRAIVAQVYAEKEARWPVLTVENVLEAAKWQEDRITELLRKVEA